MTTEGEQLTVSVSDLPLFETPTTRVEGVKVRQIFQESDGAGEYWISHTEFPPGAEHRVHRHPGRDQAIYVLSGVLVQTGPDGPLATLEAGDAIHIPAGVWHGLENHDSTPAYTLAIIGGAGGIAAAGYELKDGGKEEQSHG